MAVALFMQGASNLRVLITYEDGRVALFATELRAWSEPLQQENEGWSKIFESKQHREPSKLMPFFRWHCD